MRKKLFSIITSIASLFLLSSCGSDDPVIPVDPTNRLVNEQTDAVMTANYYWEINQNTNKDQAPDTYFNSLLNSADKTSWIAKISDLSTEDVYDVGFDYGANRYNDGKVYYIIYYVRPNTSAANAKLKRGYMISEVNNIPVTEANKSTLLKDAAKNGKIELKVFLPTNSTQENYTITATVNSPENPIYQTPDTEPILTEGTNNIGYFVYNTFNPDYDKQLVEKLQSFDNKIQYLVVDLRYNIGGRYEAALTLASALVKNRTTEDVFLINEKRLDRVPYNLIDKIDSGTAIPKLGDQLKKVYIITGQNTQGIADAFINGLRPYLGENLVVAGEKSVGTNVTVGNTDIDQIWKLNIVTGKWADKNNNSTFNTTPSILANDVNKEVVTVLQPLGNTSETILAAVIADIKGQPTTRSLRNSETVKMSSPSLTDKAKQYQSAINLD